MSYIWFSLARTRVISSQLPTLGPGVCEIRIREPAGAFRVLYVAKFVSCVYVLHAFQKKSQKTAPQALRVAAQRYGLIEDE